MSETIMHAIITATKLKRQDGGTYPVSPYLDNTEAMGQYAENLLGSGTQVDIQRAAEIVLNAPEQLLKNKPGLKVLHEALSKPIEKKPRGDMGDYKYGF